MRLVPVAYRAIATLDTGALDGTMAGATGSMVAMVTPFQDNRVDLRTFAALCERQVAAGTAALVVCGSTAEAPALSDDEQRSLIETAATAAQGRVPVIAGCGAPATAAAVDRARDALRAGADALLCAPPPYSRPTQPGVAEHVRAVATVGLPVILYDVPARTGIAISDETVAILFEAGSIIGLKDASGDLSRPARLRAMVGNGLRQFGGDDATTAAYLAMSGHGCISVTANLVPVQCRRLHEAWAIGDLVELARLRDGLHTLNQALFQESNPILVKAAMAMAGLCSPALRLPLLAPDRSRLDTLGPIVAMALDREREQVPARLAVVQ